MCLTPDAGNPGRAQLPAMGGKENTMSTIKPLKPYANDAGRKVAAKLIKRYRPHRDRHDEIITAASLIARAARTYERIQERWCSEEMGEKVTAYWERRESNLEKRIRALAKALPGVRSVEFNGDPRGFTVKLIMTDERLHDDWGRTGLGIPTS